MDLSILRSIGLSEGEIKVYSAILDIGFAQISEINVKVNVNRRNIYDILHRLMEKGLINFTEENKKRRFHITHPNKLIGFIEEKKKELDNSKELIEKEIPQIMQKFKESKPRVRTEVYQGIEGVKAYFEDSLDYSETYWIGGGRYLPRKYPNFFIPWNKRRIKKKIKWIYLMRHELRKEYKPYAFEEVKFLPEEFSGAPIVIGIFGDKVAQLLLGEEIFVFVTESKELADNYKRYHRYLWEKIAKK